MVSITDSGRNPMNIVQAKTVVEETDNVLSEVEKSQLGEKLEKELLNLGECLDLEKSATESGALLRHRGVASAMDLLRIVMAYSHLDLSFRMLGMWCVLQGVCDISKTALIHRLQKCEAWLGQLVGMALFQQKFRFPEQGSVRIKLMDASVISLPGSKGTDWRLHLGFDLGRMCMDWVEVTDKHGGESFKRFTCVPGEIYMGDRGYAVKSSIGHVLSAGAWLLVRVGWLKLPFEDAQGQAWNLIGWLKQASLLPGGEPQEVNVWVSVPQGRFALRFLTQALPPDKAEEARRRLRKEAKKKCRNVDERSLFAAGFVLLATNLPAAQWGISLIFQLYRFRWQIELAFKRLKSLLQLDGLRARDPQLAKVYLLGKILAALLIERLQLRLAEEYPLSFSSQERPLSIWRLTKLFAEQTRAIIRGEITLQRILSVFPRLVRFLCDEPRKRISQRAQAQSILSGLGGC
jgi:hypothetical protein